MASVVLMGLAISAAAVATCMPAAAQPDLPDPPPWVPLAPDVEPGSFDYPYNVIAVEPPPLTDSRGVRITATVDGPSQAEGLPGSSRGNAPQDDGPLVTSNSRYGISAGLEPPGTPTPGVAAGAGIAALPAAESPSGTPPSTSPQPESTLPDDLPLYPVPVIEEPGNPHEPIYGQPLG
ncbi:MAG: hypothetical protein PGN37_17185 [Mycobacterium kyogaense]|uniref:hypothetical protein n=1 Tax=Mycobacterium kyogaense TaxID=2212479 RepID=UPI002FF57DE3